MRVLHFSFFLPFPLLSKVLLTGNRDEAGSCLKLWEIVGKESEKSSRIFAFFKSSFQFQRDSLED